MDMSSGPFFYVSCKVHDLWFKGFTSTTPQGALLICAVVFAVALFLSYTDYIRTKIRLNVEHHLDIFQQKSDRQKATLSRQEYRRQVVFHVIQSVIHGMQNFMGNMLMLAIMSFNVWVGIAVIVGSVFGYFLFNVQPAPSYKHKCGSKEDATSSGAASPNSESSPYSSGESSLSIELTESPLKPQRPTNTPTPAGPTNQTVTPTPVQTK